MRLVPPALLVMAALALPVAGQKDKEKPLPRLVAEAVKAGKVAYAKTDKGDLYLHIFYPPGWKASDRRPVVVFFFGGGWKNGSHRQFVPQAEYFATRGLVAISADYRIASVHGTTPDRAVADARAAIRYVRGHAKELGIDPGKVIAGGGSAGGHLAAAAALLEGFDRPGDDTKVSCRPDALVLFNPALNLTGLTIRDGGGRDISKALSPTAYLKKGAPPTLLLYGTADRMLSHGREYLKKAGELGVRAELYTAADQPHGFFNRPPWLQVTTHRADEFLASLGYLSGKPTVKMPAKAGAMKKETVARED